MSATELRGGVVALEVLAVAGSGRFDQVRTGDLVEVLVDSAAFVAASRSGVRAFEEVSVRTSSAQVPGEVFCERRAEVTAVTTRPR